MVPTPNDYRFEYLAEDARLRLGIPDDERPDPIDLLTRMKVAGMVAGWEVAPDEALPNADAQWDGERIRVRERVVVEAQAGHSDAAFTIFHELAHVLLGHKSRNRGTETRRRQFGRYIVSDEEDADLLASALMSPERLAAVDQTTDSRDFARRFRMPPDKGVRRLEELKRRHRHRHGLQRSLSADYDSGDYGLAIKAMMRNAELTRRRRGPPT